MGSKPFRLALLWEMLIQGVQLLNPGIREFKLLVITAIFIAIQATGVKAQAQTIVVYSQKSLAGSTSVTPGLLDQLGLLGGPGSQRKDFYEIFVNNTGFPVLVNQVVIFGGVVSASEAVIAPVVNGSVESLPGETILVPDIDPSHALGSATVPVSSPPSPGAPCVTSTSGFTGCPITIAFSPGVILPAGGKLAFGLIAPLTNIVDADLFGTDTLPNILASTTPPYYTGFYGTSSSGVLSLGAGNHYLVISGEPVFASCSGPSEGVPWSNHGEYVMAVIKEANALFVARFITLEQRTSIVRNAASSTCGIK